MLPSLADLDVSKLSEQAREALGLAEQISDGASLAEVAGAAGITVDELKLRLERLAAEWREQAGIVGLPPLSPEEYEGLRDSIDRWGQCYPIIATPDGRIADGHHRARACRELGIDPRIEYLPDEVSDDELKCLALVLNLARRQLSASARRGIIRDELLRDPSRSDRSIATSVGVSHPTVAAVRRELEQEGTVERLSTRVGADGVTQPAGKPTREPDELPDGVIDVTLRLDKKLAAQLDGGTTVNCSGIRLVLVEPGVYALEVHT